MSSGAANQEDAAVAEAEMDGVLPEGFYATTNFDTDVRVNGDWVAVDGIEMDVGLRVERGSASRVSAVPMHQVRKGDRYGRSARRASRLR